MELPFAVFLLLLALCCWRFATATATSRHRAWAIGAGICLGLLHATKETFVIHVAAMAGAALLAGGRDGFRQLPIWLRQHATHLAIALLTGFAVSALLLSHGFRRPEAILDGLRTYALYFQRAGGTGAGHAQPWHYYFTSLFGLRVSAGFWYSEISLLLLGTAGIARAWWPGTSPSPSRKFLRALAAYTLLCMLAYSIIPYKTPWSFLATTHGLILLSATFLAGMIPAPAAYTSGPLPRWTRPALGALLLALCSTHALLYDRQLAAAPADPAQPFVYGHTSQGFLALVDEIHRLESLEGRTLTLTFCEEENGWPMPWYRRHALGFNRYGNTLPQAENTPDIVVVSAAHLPEAAQALLATHQSRRYPLRPGIDVHAFFRRSLAGLQAPASPSIGPAR